MYSWLSFTPRQLRALGFNLLLWVRLAFSVGPVAVLVPRSPNQNADRVGSCRS
jgi:hypothetical protein